MNNNNNNKQYIVIDELCNSFVYFNDYNEAKNYAINVQGVLLTGNKEFIKDFSC